MKDDNHNKVYELGRQMCDIGKTMNDPIKPLSEETAQELIGKWEKICKEWDSKKKEIVDSIFNENDMEKKKMTKAEAFEWLKCKKVSVSCREISEKVQSKLFACGVQWKTGGTDFCDYGNYYVINSHGLLGHCDGMGSYWECLINEELSADDILSIEIVDENRSDDELVEIVELGKKIQCLLSKLSGHKHVVITEDDVILYDEGMSLFHSDPF
jgi:hypothetical protein